MLHHAMRVAMTGRKGPVFLDIPRDLMNGQVLQAEIGQPDGYRPHHPQLPHPDATRQAIGVLQQAERPLMLVGGGVTWAGASELAVRLSEQYALPMITAYGRNDAVPNAHPHYIGPLGRAGSPEAGAACRRADVLLVVGSRLGNFTTFYDQRYIQPGTRIIRSTSTAATSAGRIRWPWACRRMPARRSKRCSRAFRRCECRRLARPGSRKPGVSAASA